MRILIFSDIHGDTKALEKLIAQPADIYISAGDLSTFGKGLERCGDVLRSLGEKCWVIPGNHETAAENAAFCEKFGLTDFHKQTRQLGDTWLAGLGYSNPTPFNTPGEFSEQQIADALAAFEQKSPLVLVAHTPPHGSELDKVRFGLHAGSKSVRAWVERHQPTHLFCGHIHECAGRSETIGATRCFNVGKPGRLLTL